jgi:hypothetical protein
MLIRMPQTPSEVTIKSEWFGMRDALVAEAARIPSVDNITDFVRGGALLQRVTKAKGAVEKIRKDFSKPLSEALKLLKTAADKALAPLEAAGGELKLKLSAYALRQSMAREREERLLEAAAEAAADQTLREEADRLFGSVDADIIESIPNPSPEAEPPKAESVSVRKSLTFEITGEAALPRQFLSPDEKKIRRWIEDSKESLEAAVKNSPGWELDIMPGLRLKISVDIVSR